MRSHLQKALCPACGSPFGNFLVFQVMSPPESFVWCKHCRHIIHLSSSIHLIYSMTIILTCIGMVFPTMQIIQIFFASAAEYIRIILHTVVGIGGFIISGILGSQVILRWIAKQKDGVPLSGQDN